MACYAHSEPIKTVWTYIGLLFAVSEMFRAAGCVINDMLDKDLDALVREFTLFSLLVNCDAFT
jgi:4-hydroxybenzoate polyprenyltransferase